MLFDLGSEDVGTIKKLSNGEMGAADGVRRGSEPRKEDDPKKLFYEEHVCILPDGRAASILNDMSLGRDREQHWHVSWPHLLKKRVWLDSKAKRPPIAIPVLPSHSEYLDLSQKRPGPWPYGVPTEAGMWELSWAFVMWTLNLKPKERKKGDKMSTFDQEIDSQYKGAWWTLRASIFIGAAQPLISILIGFLTDETNGSGFGNTSQMRKNYAVMFGFLTIFVYLALLRTNFYWEVKIPGACLRQHLQWILYRRMREYGSDIEAARANDKSSPEPRDASIAGTPGAAVAILGPTVDQAVESIVENFFSILITISSLVSSVIVTVFLLWFANSSGWLPIVIFLLVVIFSLVLGAALFHVYLQPMHKLERLTSQWQMRYYSLAVEQLRGEATGTTEQQVDDFWLATRLYRFRAFQSDIMELTVSDLVTAVLYLLNFGLVLLYAVETINGKSSVGTFVSLLQLTVRCVGYMGEITASLTNVPGGYRALQQIAQVINAGEDKKEQGISQTYDSVGAIGDEYAVTAAQSVATGLFESDESDDSSSTTKEA